MDEGGRGRVEELEKAEQQIYKTKSRFFQKNDKISKTLFRLKKKKIRITQITKIGNNTEVITINLT